MSVRLFVKILLKTAQLLPKHFPSGLSRSSHQRCSVKKGVLRNFTKFSEKRPWQSLFFIKVAGLRPSTLLKKRPWHRCFPLNFVKFLGTPFLKNTSGRLLLSLSLCILYFLFHKSKDTSAIPQPSIQHLVYVFPIFFRFHECFDNFHLSKISFPWSIFFFIVILLWRKAVFGFSVK